MSQAERGPSEKGAGAQADLEQRSGQGGGDAAAGQGGEGSAGESGAASGQSRELQAMTLARRSAGQPLDSGVKAEMAESFGGALGEVRVHADSVAAQAAEMMGARAFTVGSDIFFASGQFDPASEQGKQLLAHELTHVVQTGGRGPEPGAQAEVSHPGAGAEQAARQAGQRAAQGQAVGNVGQASGNTIHRDATSDLAQTSQGNWLGNVNTAQALRQIRAMSQPERTALQNDTANHATMGRLARAFSTSELLEVFALVPMDLRWHMYWSIVGDKVNAYNVAQWRWVFANATSAEVAELRNYPAGYAAFLQHGPATLVPAWDKLQGLKSGQWSGSASDIRDAVNQLNPEQRVRVREDQAMMNAILTRSGTAYETFRTVTYLEIEIRWAIWYLNSVGKLAELTPQNWAQMMMEAPRAEIDLLVAWPDGWALTQRFCPAATLQMCRQNNTTDGSVDAQFADPVAMRLMFTSMGPEAFLAAATQPGSDVPGNYAKIKAASLVHPVLDGLQRGPKLGERTIQNLFQWFDAPTGETDVPTLEKMVTVRFRVTTGGTGSYTHGQRADGTIDPNTNIQPWTPAGLRMCWTVMERLPPTQVEQNSNLLHLIRNSAAGNGDAAYGSSPDVETFGDITMGYRNDGELGQTSDATAGVYQAGGQGAGSAAVNMNKFNATLRHEIGHAVDRNLHIMDEWRNQTEVGNWQKYPNYTAFVDAIIAAGGGLGTATAPRHGYAAADVSQYRQAMLNAIANGQTFQVALTALKGDAAVAPDAGPISAVFTTARWTGGGTGPWYSPGNATKQAAELGGRVFQRSYDGPDSLWSYRHAARAAHEVTNYQWRAPGEWFAEVYQVYYAEQERDPRAPVGGILRSKDPYAAQMLANIVDRGFSPQDMRGTSTPAPGTGP